MKKVLVIDDDSFVRTGLVLALRRNGYDTLDASDGLGGLELAFTQRPDIIITDINLPGQNGLDILKALHAREETAAVPVILMTGEPHKADARLSMNLGADDYLQKPFGVDQLLATLNARLDRQNGIQRALEARSRAERIGAAEKLRLQTTALEAAANSIVITNRRGEILWVNRAFTQLTGYTADEVVGQNPRLLNSGRVPRQYFADLWTTINTGNVWHGELINKRKDGSCYYEEMTITPVCGENGEVQNFVAIKQDITERKQQELALAHKRDLLQALMDNLPDHIYFKDVNSRFTRVNQALAIHLGLEHPDDAIGKSDADFFPMRQARQKLVDERCLLATGQPILGLVEKSDTVAGDTWVSSTKVPTYGTDGQITGLVGISRDITEIKRGEEERQRMELQLRQAQKLESIGQLAAGIAHEINTPIQYVGDNTRFVKDSFAAIARVMDSHVTLLKSAKAGAVTAEQLDRAGKTLAESDLEYLCLQIPQALIESLEGVERVSKIVRAMKEFSHPGGTEKTPADLNKAIESTITVAHNEWKYIADMKLDLDPALPFVPCFLGEINQAVLNLIVNAAHAIGDVVKKTPGTKGLITIQTLSDGGHVEIRVTDTGTGIPEETRPRIFEPFFTTKAVGRGTGQGLAMVYGSVVHRHGGTATFETDVGRGTTFIIRLPVKSNR